MHGVRCAITGLSLALDSSFMHSLGVRGEASSDHQRSFLYSSRLTAHGFLNIGEAAPAH